MSYQRILVYLTISVFDFDHVVIMLLVPRKLFHRLLIHFLFVLLLIKSMPYFVSDNRHFLLWRQWFDTHEYFSALNLPCGFVSIEIMEEDRRRPIIFSCGESVSRENNSLPTLGTFARTDCMDEGWAWLLFLLFVLECVELLYFLTKDAVLIDLNKALAMSPKVMFFIIIILLI